jgi:hypothetical protein
MAGYAGATSAGAAGGLDHSAPIERRSLSERRAVDDGRVAQPPHATSPFKVGFSPVRAAAARGTPNGSCPTSAARRRRLALRPSYVRAARLCWRCSQAVPKSTCRSLVAPHRPRHAERPKLAQRAPTRELGSCPHHRGDPSGGYHELERHRSGPQQAPSAYATGPRPSACNAGTAAAGAVRGVNGDGGAALLTLFAGFSSHGAATLSAGAGDTRRGRLRQRHHLAVQHVLRATAPHGGVALVVVPRVY